jgi:hypothetical protein
LITDWKFKISKTGRIFEDAEDDEEEDDGGTAVS